MDLTGNQYGRLTVLRFVGVSTTNAKYWECQCECGAIKTIAAKHFTTGKTVSCRCFGNENTSRVNRTHGESNWTGDTPEYRAYMSAKQRCTSPSIKCWHNYGGRGIEFRFATYEEFLAEVGRKPTPQHSLERIDVDGHYEVGNVKWATAQEQARNKRGNVLITLGDETLCQAEWMARVGITEATFKDRLEHRWCLPCALTVPAYGTRCPHRN